MEQQIEVVDVFEQPMAATTRRLAPADIPEKTMAMTDKVWAFLRAEGIAGHGHNVWLYRQTGDGRMDVQVGVQVAATFEGKGEIVCLQTPEGRAAHAVHYGEYHDLPKVHQAVTAWCRSNGHAAAGVGWEVYGDWQDDPAERRTDVYCLLED